jgi:ribosome biogenesis ATPase
VLFYLLCSQLLIELDGAGQHEGVYVIGATNRYCQPLQTLYVIIPERKASISMHLYVWCRIDVIDDAVLRPGRFGQKHFVPLPGAEERASIIKALAHSQKKPISSTVDLDALARREECRNLSGADLESLVIFVPFH